MATTPMTHARPSARPEREPVDEQRGIEALYATGHWLFSQGRAADAACVFRAMALLAPKDERAWLGLGACHEALSQVKLALEMYGTGRVLTHPSVRCDLARARVLHANDRCDEADAALEDAAASAEALEDEALIQLVVHERRAR